MLADNTSRKVAIVGYNRIPFARNNSAYTEASNLDMMTAALNGLIDRYRLQGKLLGRSGGRCRDQKQHRPEPDARSGAQHIARCAYAGLRHPTSLRHGH